MKEVDVENQTQRIMALKRILQVLVQYEIILITSPSIAGVTYRDHFNFEERYRDANECNPFYWHPLHLPPKCALLFEKAIRSRLASNTADRLMIKRHKKKHHHSDSYSDEYYKPPFPFYEMSSAEFETQRVPLTPQEEMLEILKKDIEKEPSYPTVTIIPNFGPVALYKQTISRKTEKKLKSMAQEYAKASKKMYDKYYKQYPAESKLFVYDGSKNKTTIYEKEKPIKDKSKEEKRNKVHRVKTKNGNVVTIIETMNVEAMKPDVSFI